MSSQYAAFLRGINLGRQRRVGGAELRDLFANLGFDDVATFRTSGNVVFAAADERESEIGRRIEHALQTSLGYEVAVFLRSEKQLRALADVRPFTPVELKRSKGKQQVMLLSKKPSARARAKVLELATDENALAFGDRELHWLPSGGTRDSGLDLSAVESLIGPTTMRTKGTIDQLAAKYFAA
jgi:uncharacterized protein (DUF1697 family)